MLLCCLFVLTSFAQTGPAGVNNGAVLWLDAGDVLNGGTAPAYGSTLTTWFDKSGSGNNAVSFGANSVTYNSGGANDRPVVHFNRTSATAGSGMTVSGLNIRAGTLSDVTIFAVYRPGTNDGNAQAVWGNDNGGTAQRYFNSKAATGTTNASLNTGGTAVVIPGGAQSGETRLVTAVYSSSGGNNASAVYLNGKLIAAFTDQTAGATGRGDFRIGLDGDNNYYNGDISELVVYNRKLSACEIEQINIYLANKYTTDFTDMASNYTLGIPYNNDVNGVGIRTSACSGTYNMSASFSGIVSVTNPSQTNTNVVLSFGNDRAGYGLSSQTPSSHISRLQQVWRADLNGNIGTVDICFELTGLGIDVSNSGNFALLIDKDGDFSNATAISTGITTLVNRVCISGVSLTKGDYFTLATKASTSVAAEITSTNQGTQQKSLFTTATVVDNQILVKGAASVTDGRVYIDAGFVNGDVISWGTLPAGITANYTASTGVAVFTGSASATAWQDFYRTIKFNTTSGNTGNRTIKFVLGNVVSYTVGTKPHYYEYITTPMSWTAAKAAAEARTLYGLQGYLATITAQIENDFITSKLSSDGWVGGSCDYQYVNTALGRTQFNDQASAYGYYYWVTGPEKGTAISTGLVNPVAVNGAYMKWNGAEPNNYQNTDERYMQLYSTNQGRWNDLSNSNNLGYVVEYGGYASDPVLNIDYSRVIANAPPAPNIVSITDDTGLSTTDTITNDATLKLNGTGQASATIKVYRADLGSTILGSTTVDASGNWTFDYTATSLTDGTYSFTATATTGSNTSAVSPVFKVTVDLTAPAKPGMPALASGPGNATNDVTPDLTGSAEPGSQVKVYDGATLIGTIFTNAAGVWSLTAPTMTVSLHNITVTATDVAGNTSVSSDPFPLTVDVTAPAKPAAPTLVGGVGNVTNDNTPDIKGTAEANSTVTVYSGNTIVGTTKADASGNYTFTFPVLADGPYVIRVTATDAAGNTSTKSNALNFSVDTQAPAVPTLITAATLTTNRTPTVTGKTDANTAVTIYKDGTAVGTVTSNGSGDYTYTFTPALPDATYVITATAADAVGNVSAASTPLSITVDATAPAPPVITTSKVVTNNNTPTITGTAEANSVVTIYRGTTAVGTVTATAGGTFTYTFATLADAVYAVSATARDAAGNVSGYSNVLNITIDTQAPLAPVVISRTTPANDNTPTLTGTAEANSTVTVYADGVYAGTTTANASGAFTFTFNTSLVDGLRAVTATATDAAGNTGPLSAALNINVDTQAPGAPTITTAKNPTNDNTPDVAGKAEAGSTVTIIVDGTAVGSTNADGAGNYTFTIPTPLADGAHTIKATATDGAGNTGPESNTLNLTIDTQAPSAPIITTAKNPTGDNTPDVTGTAEANSTVTIIVDGAAVGTTTATAGGTYTYTLPALADGLHTVKATASDAAGNSSAESNTLNLTVDTQAPSAPTITTAKNPTNDNTPDVTGTAEANSRVTIIIDGVIIGTTTATAGGTYTYTLPVQTNGAHTVKATATDAAGNTSGESNTLQLKIDTQAPSTPSAPIYADGRLGGLTNDNTPDIKGQTEPGSTVTIYVDGISVGATTADGSGAYTYTLPLQIDGDHTVAITATDAADNTSGMSPVMNITVDTEAPGGPTITTTKNPTNDNTPDVTGTAEANSTVTIIVDGVAVGTTTATAGGTYSFTLPVALADGSHTVNATATDAAGNISVESNTLNLMVDTQAPGVTTITTAKNPTNDNTPDVTGTAEANSTVSIIVDGTVVGTTTATAGGTYSYTLPVQADGAHTVKATATDAAGNTSPESNTLTLRIDTQAPVAPTISTSKNPTNDSTPDVTGNAEANSTVTIIVDGVAIGTTTASASGSYIFTLPIQADGAHTVKATATDAAGNTSPESNTLNLTIDTSAPLAPTLTTAKNPTNDNTPDVTGSAEANSTVTIIVDGTVVGATTTTAGGTYTFTLPVLADGSHTVKATASDAAGNNSVESNTLNLTIDTGVPATPTITTAKNPTNDNTPDVTGTAEANSTVTIIVDGGAVGTTTATAGGTYTYTLPVLADGPHTVKATATDAADNTSVESNTLTLVIDTGVPGVPTITTAKNPTNDNTPEVTGDAEANSIVNIIVNGVAVGITTADGAGKYNYTLPVQADGPHTVKAIATDAAGNTSAESNTLNLIIDTGVPSAPTVTTAKNPTNDNTPDVTGDAEANSTVTIIVDGTTVGTTTADGAGKYTYTLPVQADGPHTVKATATDAAGNTSPESNTLNVTIDTGVPATPTINTAKNPTNDNTPDVTGTAEANSTVTIIVDGVAVGTTTATAGGSYTYTLPVQVDGPHTVKATATDAAGNTSAESNTLNMNIDTGVPTVPTITTAKNPTNDNTPTVTGTAEANSTVIIYNGITKVTDVTVDATGNYTYTFTTSLADGTYPLTATSTDAAGNTSVKSTVLTLEIDTKAPAAPTLTTAKNPTNDNTPDVNGTAEANSTVKIIVDGVAVGTTTADVVGNYTYTLPLQTDGTHIVKATATDAAGNTSAPSDPLNLFVNTGTPTVPTLTTAENPTNDHTPIVTGNAEANSDVTIYEGTAIITTVRADGSGHYTYTFTSALVDGTHPLTATATNTAGTTSGESAVLNLVIDTQTPPVPTILTAKNPTSDNTPTVTGSAEANSSVTIYDGSTIVTTVMADASGDYTYTFTTALADGTYPLTATSTDAAGNTSAKSVVLDLVVDTQAPAVPTITTAKNPTRDNTPTVTGTAEANSKVTIYEGNTPITTVIADASGNYTYTFTAVLTDGTHPLTATATDGAGNTSAKSNVLNLVVDTQAPTAPVVTARTTPANDNTPTVIGTAEANSTVTIYADGAAVGTTTADATGKFTYTFTTALSDGMHAIAATATDAAGNISPVSATLNINIDTRAPAAPTLTTAKNPTNDNTPTVTGRAEANSTVTIYTDGTAIGTTTADVNGLYTYTFNPALTDGTHALTARATDASGNTSVSSAALNLVVDTQAPAAPTVTTAKNPTNDNTPTITGKAEPNSTVTIYDGNNVVGTVPTDANGSYSYTFNPALSDGPHNITTTATDAAGNTSDKSAQLPVVVDTHAPATPPSPVLEDGRTGGLINDNTPSIKGTAEANSTVTIYLNGKAVGTTKADAAGNYTYTFSPALADASYAITVTATDAAGNTSAQSPALNITIDSAAPATPAAPQLIGGKDGIINDATPSIKGDAEPNSTVTVYVDGKSVGTTKADAAGHYTYTINPALADGKHDITVTATDAAGNTSGQSPALSIVVDTRAPNAPTVTTDKLLTNDNTPVVTGKAEPNSTVTLYVDGRSVGTVTADNKGDYHYELTPALTDGGHSITATATDAAGNVSLASATLYITVDTKPPAAPTVVLVTPDTKGVVNTTRPTIGGSAEPNSTVTIYADGKPVGTGVADASGRYTYTFNPGLSQGDHVITATATDAAGNTSAPSVPLHFGIDAIPPAVPDPPTLPGINIPGLVNITEPTITGHGEPGTLITIYTDGKPVGNTAVKANGEWAYTYNPPLSEGPHYITVTAVDVLGNESAHSSQVVLTVDLTRPEISMLTLSAEPLSGPVTFSLTFTEDVIGFESSDINIVGGKVTQFKQLSSSSYAVVIAPDVEGVMLVNVPADGATDLAGNGNKVSSTIALRVKFGSGIDLVYPQPATDILNVRFNGVDDGNATYSLTSMAGQVLMQQSGAIHNGILTINTQRVPSGTYVLFIRTKEKTLNTTIVIAR
ncbi:Ig-like domain-containing protein [Chitinophaga agri]|uniref:T9SS type A sorting domain-containing protein n=1 Tax=Chitinophaga agri TaxID=2703787 RepID=A0A6B9Z999_9BACT|nr:Ig-like domain-containing protein [Chitinophaga agri]QHS58617.1 T9SS type A sorting domain-containing protein [Chitinophaga agri]